MPFAIIVPYPHAGLSKDRPESSMERLEVEAIDQCLKDVVTSGERLMALEL